MGLQLLCVNWGNLDDAVKVVRHCQEIMPVGFFEVSTIIHPKPPFAAQRGIYGGDLEIIRAHQSNMCDCWINQVPEEVKRDRVLAVHWDGFIVRPDLWNNDFLMYDWIGAPWRKENIFNLKWRVGSGGFCLFSKQMAALWKILLFDREINHDWQIGALMRDHFEAMGMHFPTLLVASQFAKECDLEDLDIPEGSSFGFHGFQYAKEREIYRKRVYAPVH